MGIVVPTQGWESNYPAIKGNMIQTVVEYLYKLNLLHTPGPELLKAVQAFWRRGLVDHNPLRWISPEELLHMRNEVLQVLTVVLTSLHKHKIYRENNQTEKSYFYPIPSTSINMFGRADLIIFDTVDWLS